MRVMSLLALGMLGVGVGVGCSEGDQPSANAPAQGAQAAELVAARPPRIAATVEQENYVSNLHLTDVVQDDNLQNAWGLAFVPQGVGWVSSNGGGFLEAYQPDGIKRLEVPVPGPGPAKEAAAPTGLIFNPDSSTSFMGDVFIAVTEDGTVVGWQPGFATTVTRFTTKDGAIYKGVAAAKVDGHSRLYATDFFNGKVDVFDDAYQLLKIRGDFRDKALPKNYAPFNVLAVRDHLIVTYAQQEDNRIDDAKGPGHGIVDLFDADGDFEARLISHGVLNSPWGLAIAPEPDDGGGAAAKAPDGDKRKKPAKDEVHLLVGNFGDGRINVFNLSFRHGQVRADFDGVIADTTGKPLVIDGLWALAFGLGGGFDEDDLYFTAGPNDETDGLFGELGFVAPLR